MSEAPPALRPIRVRHAVRKRPVEVARVDPIGRGFLGVTFSGESLADFSTLSFDDHVRVQFASPGGETQHRDYTPRHYDRGRCELTIEIALHEGGAACAWALAARRGTPAVIAGPKSSMVIPVDYPWHLLAGDCTALPAIHRRLEELPEGVQAWVLVLPGCESRPLASAASLTVQWLQERDDAAARLLALALPTTPGFAWCAGEAGQMARLREVLAVGHKLPREAVRVAAYWKQGSDSFHEVL